MKLCFNALSTAVQPEKVSGKCVAAVFVEITSLHLFIVSLLFFLYLFLRMLSLLFSYDLVSTHCTCLSILQSLRLTLKY